MVFEESKNRPLCPYQEGWALRAIFTTRIG